MSLPIPTGTPDDGPGPARSWAWVLPGEQDRTAPVDVPRVPSGAAGSSAPGPSWQLLAGDGLARVYLATLAGLTLWSFLPLLLGWSATIVVSGSMSPAISTGSVLVSSPIDVDAVRPGNVVLFQDPAARERLMTHRVVRVEADGGLVTRGDANPGADSTAVRGSDLRGLGRLLVPAAGWPVLWARSGSWLPLLCWGLLTAGAVAVVLHARRRSGPGRTTPRPWVVTVPEQRRAGPAPSRPVTVLTVAVLVLGGTAALPVLDALPTAAAAFSASTRNPGSGFAVDPAAQYGPSSYAAQVSSVDSPTVLLLMDEVGGPNAVNAGSAGPAADATYTSTGVTYGVSPGATPREPGRAVTLNGTSGCVYGKQRILGPQVFTIEVWFRTTTALGGKIMGFGTGANEPSPQFDRHLYMTRTGRLIFGSYGNGIRTVATPRSYNDGSWHLATATVGAAGTVLYVDGEPIAANSNTQSEALNGYWRVGCDATRFWPEDPMTPFFAGSVDNAAVYPTALSAERVRAHWYGA